MIDRHSCKRNKNDEEGQTIGPAVSVCRPGDFVAAPVVVLLTLGGGGGVAEVLDEGPGRMESFQSTVFGVDLLH